MVTRRPYDGGEPYSLSIRRGVVIEVLPPAGLGLVEIQHLDEGQLARFLGVRLKRTFQRQPAEYDADDR